VLKVPPPYGNEEEEEPEVEVAPEVDPEDDDEEEVEPPFEGPFIEVYASNPAANKIIRIARAATICILLVPTRLVSSPRHLLL